MTYRWQPDFVITVAGKDITKLVESWTLNDVEDGISNLNVALVNQYWDFDGKVDDEVTIKFGLRGDLTDKVVMKIKEYTETYSVGGSRVSFTAHDCMERLTGVSAHGFFQHKDTEKAIKQIGEMIEQEVKVKTQDMKSPEFPDDYKISIANQRLVDAQRELLNTMGNLKKKRMGKTSSASGTKAIKKQTKGKKIADFDGVVKEGLLLAQGPYSTEQKVKDINNLMKNAIEQSTESASGETIRASVRVVGIPQLKAKTVITVNNVGRHSGKWYVKGVTHSWDKSGAYTANADLIKADGDAPLVRYAEIYEKDTMYCGPRKVDAESSLTFTFGREDKRIIDFKWSESVQEARAAGERSQSDHIPVDSVKEEEIYITP
jgi:hypothetical protein